MRTRFKNNKNINTNTGINTKYLPNYHKDLVLNKNFRNNQNYISSKSIEFKMFYEYFEKINIFYTFLAIIIGLFLSSFDPALIIIFIFGLYFLYLYIKNTIILRFNKYEIKFKNKRMNYWYIFRNKVNIKLNPLDFLFISKKAFYKIKKNYEK